MTLQTASLFDISVPIARYPVLVVYTYVLNTSSSLAKKPSAKYLHKAAVPNHRFHPQCKYQRSLRPNHHPHVPSLTFPYCSSCILGSSEARNNSDDYNLLHSHTSTRDHCERRFVPIPPISTFGDRYKPALSHVLSPFPLTTLQSFRRALIRRCPVLTNVPWPICFVSSL